MHHRTRHEKHRGDAIPEQLKKHSPRTVMPERNQSHLPSSFSSVGFSLLAVSTMPSISTSSRSRRTSSSSSTEETSERSTSAGLWKGIAVVAATVGPVTLGAMEATTGDVTASFNTNGARWCKVAKVENSGGGSKVNAGPPKSTTVLG